MAAAVLLGAVAGTSLGLLESGGRGPTAAAPARAATAPPSSSRAATTRGAAASHSGGAPTEQRLSAPRRQLDRVKAAKPKHKEPGHSDRRGHGDGDGKGNGHGKGEQAHRR